MFGLSTSLELRLALYGFVLAAIGGWLVYEHHHLIAEGEATVKAQDTAARASQKAEDDRTSAGVINDLKAKLAAIPPAQPPPVLRLCQPFRSVRASPATSGAQPSLVGPAGTSSFGVPDGVTAGPDIGPFMQDSERAARVLAIYADETRDWAVRQSK